MDTQKKKQLQRTLVAVFIMLFAVAAHYLWEPWGFYRKVTPEEAALRTSVVRTAQDCLGASEADGSHRQIIDHYNAHEPLAMGYVVQYEDSWCAAFVSAVAIQCDLTRIIPTECSCERQIELLRNLGYWEESDSAIPLPGDLIFYDWNMEKKGECTGWADHVGIVVGTKWPFVKVIEGNYDDCVQYRYLLLDHVTIRGFGKPDYTSLTTKTP